MSSAENGGAHSATLTPARKVSARDGGGEEGLSEFQNVLRKARRRSENFSGQSPTSELEARRAAKDGGSSRGASGATQELKDLLSRQEEQVSRHEATLAYARNAGISITEDTQNQQQQRIG